MGLALAMTLILSADLAQPLALGRKPVGITLISPGDADTRRRVERVASAPEESVVLRLGRLAAAEDPGVSWEVHALPADPAASPSGASLVGLVSMYGAALETEAVYALDAAIAAGKGRGLRLVFVPVSGLEVEDETAPAAVASTMTIGAISLEVERAPGGRSSP
jgi:hypothetical protein